jgi:hypothetical protein
MSSLQLPDQPDKISTQPLWNLAGLFHRLVGLFESLKVMCTRYLVLSECIVPKRLGRFSLINSRCEDIMQPELTGKYVFHKVHRVLEIVVIWEPI